MAKCLVADAAICCRIIATAAAVLLAGAAYPADQNEKPNRIERTAKKAGKFVEKTATRAGKFVERTASKTEKAVKRALE